ncbi:MAG: hypothetical protein ABL929_07675 [Ferruginibacter sp.]|nr:hypothetical protein [Ferruginibacter sp.]
MKNILTAFFVLFTTQNSIAQNHIKLHGMYIQWGYNKEWYTKSNLHIRLSNGDNFILKNVTAKDKPDYDAIYKKPVEISIPQYNYRLGFYLNKKRTRAIELNFDHIKYVVTDGQTARVKGIINGVQVNADSVLNPATFLHFEHTDGGNLLHINYVDQKTVLQNNAKTRPLVNLIWKLGAGINIPRTDFTYKGDRYNNNFHVSGYNVSAEAGARLYVFKKFFIEGTGKTGYVRYVNALANTTALKGNNASHGIGYFEFIGLLGYNIHF